MENNENRIITVLAVGKEYQIPELVDLNSIGESMGLLPCRNGSGDSSTCGSGSLGDP